MISSICQKTAEALGRKLEANNDQMAVYAYAMEILLGSLIKITLIIVLALILGIFKTTLIFLFTFALFRWLGGGVHCSTYLSCLTVGLLLILSMGYIATLHIQKYSLVSLYLLSLAIAIYVIFRWVPAGTDKRKIIAVQERFKQKKESFCALLFWNIVVLICIFNNLYSDAIATILGSLFSSFFMMPIGYQFIDALDGLLVKTDKGGEECV